ncbi:MAG: universal stress protein [Flavobacteriaceae bacterium]|nr:universal stress protein [Flavobacteriaceae bacterium]
MKKLLVPTDFSEQSEYALNVAAQIAKDTNAEIVVTHMMGLHNTLINTTDNRSAEQALFQLKLSQKNFESFLDKDYLKGIQVIDTVENQTVFSGINEVVKKNDIDLIIMGSHGTTGLMQDIFVGSNTEKVVRTSEVPVLVIKNKRENFKINDVVFACDFKLENINVYKQAMKLFQLFNANVHLIYINIPQKFKSTEQMKEMVTDFLTVVDGDSKKNIEKVVYFDDFSVEEGIFNYAKSVDADLVAIPTHGRKGLAHFFAGSITEDIANHLAMPVMTFKL